MIARKHDQLPLDFGTLKAGEITSAIIAYLTRHGFKVWRQNTSGIYDQHTGRWRKNPQGCNGVPDIIGFRLADGVFVGVEVKAGRDTLRDDQKQFLNELKQAGGVAFVAYDFAQFQQSFECRGLHLQHRHA
ncbi:VRR-NUC domain-containing protein [Hymenobacter sp.]|uniref:VRR-NUC domain-containing protein n=1 Tax=Hymenobacter sp. TaxID=1898978 RepID=UPI00286C339D|nr:VRR-NUC domain-containing protein [Hymenobacter sp.]